MYRLKITGTKDKTAAKINKTTDPIEKASDVLVILYNVFPASIARNDGGATPTNVPTVNGIKGIPITGAVKFINQFGKNGVTRRKIM